jgi:DNA-binding LacI/PurR family transcriptional regulator
MSSKPPHPPKAARAIPSSTTVAQLAGVSQSTVSRVFNAGAAGVSADARKRVMQAAAKLGYQPNALPGILQTGRSGIVAVVMGGFYNPFFTEALRCVSSILHARRVETMLVETSDDDNLHEIVGDLSRYRIDGVISLLAIGSARVARQLEHAAIPIVAMNSKSIGNLRTVSTDNRSAGALAADLLIDGGCRRMAYFAGRESASQSERQAGFLKRLAKRQMPAPERIIAGFTYDEGYAAAIKLLASGSRPDGIFCVNDLVAIGAMDAIRNEFGFAVPGDIQVVGFDDIEMAGWRAIDLTTFHQDIPALALESVNLLSDKPPVRSITIMPTLVQRSTTRGHQKTL